ncbi:hypothetical protein [Lactococcus termiticola]|nr:hypothetical protein [Lactococcus termiticola]
MTVITRKTGNSIILTVPSKFNIKEGNEFEPRIDENGVIQFIPVDKLSNDELEDLHTYMDNFQPLMDKLKDM